MGYACSVLLWFRTHKKDRIYVFRKVGAADKPCGGGSADANPKLVAKRYMIA